MLQNIDICININMDFEDNRNAMYCDPNAYIQNYNKKETKKVVFQQPYECLPAHYVNNNFAKHNCDCIPNCKPKPKCDCEKNDKGQKCNNSKPGFPFSFDLKSLLPLLSGLGVGKGGGINNIISMLGNGNSESKNSSGIDFSKLISSLISNSNGLNLFNLFSKKSGNTKKEIPTTDIPIKNYTRVE